MHRQRTWDIMKWWAHVGRCSRNCGGRSAFNLAEAVARSRGNARSGAGWTGAHAAFGQWQIGPRAIST
jgi:hypothetical protein